MRKLTIAGFALATALTAGCATTDQAAIDEANATASSAAMNIYTGRGSLLYTRIMSDIGMD